MVLAQSMSGRYPYFRSCWLDQIWLVCFLIKEKKGSKMKLKMISGKKSYHMYLRKRKCLIKDLCGDEKGEPQKLLLTCLSQCVTPWYINPTVWDLQYFPIILALGPSSTSNLSIEIGVGSNKIIQWFFFKQTKSYNDIGWLISIIDLRSSE